MTRRATAILTIFLVLHASFNGIAADPLGAGGVALVPNARQVNTTAPLTGGGDLTATRTIAIPQANGSTDGYLAQADWTTFNNKVATSRSISTTAPLTGGGDLSANRTLAIPAATGSVDGYLAQADWTTFNNKVGPAPSGGMYSGAVLTPWVNTNNGISLVWRKPPEVSGFTGIAGEWSATTVNGGSTGIPVAASDTAEAGSWSFTTGTSTNGISGARLVTTGIPLTTNTMALMWRIKTPSALSDNSSGYELYIGFADNVTDAAPVDGCFFYYLHSVSNGVWTAKTSNNSVVTFASGAPTTPPTVAVDTWYNLLVEASTTVANFWVSSDDGVTWQWIGFSSSNLPTTTARVFGNAVLIRKVGGSSGAATRTLYAGRNEFWPPRSN